jgi:L-ascorbate 6-phosphate lactonase
MKHKPRSRMLLLYFLPALIALAGWDSDAAAPATRLIDEIRRHHKGMAVWWTGHNGWLIKSDSLLVSFDLALESGDRKVPAPVSALELSSELDIAFITHEHGDHFERETCAILNANSHCLFVMPASCLEAAREMKIPESRIKIAEPRKPFDLGAVRVEPIRAIHGGPRFAVFVDANLQDCGYVVCINGKRLLQMGDTVLLEDHLFLEDIDVLFFSPTEHNTHIDPSLVLINELQPKTIFPQHRDTFQVTPENRYWTTAYTDEVRLRLCKSLQEAYHILDMGEKMLIQ